MASVPEEVLTPEKRLHNLIKEIDGGTEVMVIGGEVIEGLSATQEHEFRVAFDMMADPEHPGHIHKDKLKDFLTCFGYSFSAKDIEE
jgi:hypothetical protein